MLVDTTSAYTFGGYLENVNALSINEKARKGYTRYLSRIYNTGSGTINQARIESFVAQLKEITPTGRILQNLI